MLNIEASFKCAKKSPDKIAGINKVNRFPFDSADVFDDVN